MRRPALLVQLVKLRRRDPWSPCRAWPGSSPGRTRSHQTRRRAWESPMARTKSAIAKGKPGEPARLASVRGQAPLRHYARAEGIVASRGRRRKRKRRCVVRGPEARRAPPALRRAPGNRRGHGQLGGPQGAELRPGGEAPRGPDRGPPHGVQRLRGAHPGRAVRRGRRAHLGPRAPTRRCPPGQERAMLEKGHLHLRFFGREARGRLAPRADRRTATTGDDAARASTTAREARAAPPG